MIQLKHPSNLEVKGSWVWNKNIFDAGALLTSKYLRYGRHCIAISAKREFTIGYGLDCDIVYMNPCVSDKHCILWFEYSSKSVAPTCFIKDVSVSGTYINGNLLGNGNVTIVKDLDIVRIGRFQEFRILELYNQVTTILESERTNFKKCFPKWDIVGPAIGYGAFGSVHKVRKRDSLNVFAIKISKKNYVLDYKSLFLEAVILLQLNHVCS